MEEYKEELRLQIEEKNKRKFEEKRKRHMAEMEDEARLLREREELKRQYVENRSDQESKRDSDKPQVVEVS